MAVEEGLEPESYVDASLELTYQINATEISNARSQASSCRTSSSILVPMFDCSPLSTYLNNTDP